MNWDTAYCAPGRKVLAGIALMLQGEQAGRIVEHPWLEGDDSVILVREPVVEMPPVRLQPLVAPAKTCLFCCAPFSQHRKGCPLLKLLEPGPISLIAGLQ